MSTLSVPSIVAHSWKNLEIWKGGPKVTRSANTHSILFLSDLPVVKTPIGYMWMLVQLQLPSLSALLAEVSHTLVSGMTI